MFTHTLNIICAFREEYYTEMHFSYYLKSDNFVNNTQIIMNKSKIFESVA